MSSTKYNYDWYNYNTELMKEFNWFLYKINERSNIQLGYVDDVYENVNRHGKVDYGLQEDVEYFHPTITLDDRMRFIGQEIASLDTSIMNIVGNTFISHFYGGRGVHFLASGKDNVAFCGYHGWHDWYLATNMNNSKNLDKQLLPGLKTRGVSQSFKNSIN